MSWDIYTQGLCFLQNYSMRPSVPAQQGAWGEPGPGRQTPTHQAGLNLQGPCVGVSAPTTALFR